MPTDAERDFLRLVLCLLCCALLAGCTGDRIERQESFVFGTRVEVLVFGLDRAQARDAAGEVLREFDRLHRLAPRLAAVRTDAHQCCHRCRGLPVDIDPEIAALLKGAADAATRGENLFNPAAGALIAAWGFHADEFRPQRPDDATVAALLLRGP
jgi:thiamine biosynthesis lipoprotein